MFKKDFVKSLGEEKKGFNVDNTVKAPLRRSLNAKHIAKQDNTKSKVETALRMTMPTKKSTHKLEAMGEKKTERKSFLRNGPKKDRNIEVASGRAPRNKSRAATKTPSLSRLSKNSSQAMLRNVDVKLTRTVIRRRSAIFTMMHQLENPKRIAVPQPYTVKTSANPKASTGHAHCQDPYWPTIYKMREATPRDSKHSVEEAKRAAMEAAKPPFYRGGEAAEKPPQMPFPKMRHTRMSQHRLCRAQVQLRGRCDCERKGRCPSNRYTLYNIKDIRRRVEARTSCGNDGDADLKYHRMQLFPSPYGVLHRSRYSTQDSFF